MSSTEYANEKKTAYNVTVEGSDGTSLNNSPILDQDMGYLQSTDIALEQKIALVNDALDEVGFTRFHFFLFLLAGFGYAADSQIAQVQSATQTYINYQFGEDYPLGTTFAYVGLLLGAIAIGFSADIIGRKTAFNFSLLLSSLFGFMAGGSSSLAMYLLNMALSLFFLGGNLALDVTLLLEYLPHKYQYLNTFLACFWGIGQTICELVAWATIPSNSCSSADNCQMHENRGWRYCWYGNSAIVLFFAILRVGFFNFHETPKYLVCNKRDSEAVEIIQDIANKYNRSCSLTLEQMEECGEIHINGNFFEDPSLWHSIVQSKDHVKSLFINKTVGRSNILLIISWFGIGITYGMYNNFLYAFLASQGADTGTTTFEIYRDATISCFFSIFGPPLAALVMWLWPNKVGSRGSMAIGGITSMICLMAYTKVRSEAANIVMSSLSYILINMYYGTLYAYTPEVMASVSRATGASLTLASNRVAGILVPVIYYFSKNSNSSAPIYVCGAVIGVVGILALFMPFEPTKQRSV